MNDNNQQQQQLHDMDTLSELNNQYNEIIRDTTDDIDSKIERIQALVELGRSATYNTQFKGSDLAEEIYRKLQELYQARAELYQAALARERAALAQERELYQGALARERAALAQERELRDGSYFSTLKDVVSDELKEFNVHASFIRSKRHIKIGDDDRYEKTVNVAKVDIDRIAYNSSRSWSTSRGSDDKDSTRSSFGNENKGAKKPTCNTFRNKDNEAQLAHLLSHGPECCKLWFACVPWVLCTGMENHTWEFLQGCINGNKHPVDTSTTTLATKVSTSKGRTSLGLKIRKNVSKALNLKKELPSKASSTTKVPTRGSKNDNIQEVTNSRRMKHLGIKHFTTNQIRISGQKYLDDVPCLIIVPILTVKEVVDWNGEGYSAIVLAGDWNDGSNIFNAAEVYVAIKASQNITIDNICFANEIECNDAVSLLEQMILSVCHEFNKYGDQFVPETFRDNLKFNEWQSGMRAISTGTVPVPKLKNWNDSMKIRKITFDKRTEPGDINRAPDPTLLLAKATSIWLKRHNIQLLPVYSDDDTSNSDSSDSLSSYCSEDVDKLGLTSNCLRYHQKPPIEEVNIAVNEYAVDEILSDNEVF